MGVAVIAAGSACSSAMEERPANAFTGAAATTVMVNNNNWSDMTVYATRNGATVRLGSVTSMSTARFELPVAMLGAGELRLIADPLGSTSTYRTQPVLVTRGQEIEFTLQNNLALSTLSVW
jgi:hypothetical protein